MLNANQPAAAPRPAAPLRSPHPQPARWGLVVLVIGGLLFVAAYILVMTFELATGRVPQNRSAYEILLNFIPTAGMTSVGLAMAALAAWMRPYAPRLGTAALGLSALAVAVTSFNLALISGITGTFQPIGFLGMVGVLGDLSSATLLGIAALRTGALPRPIAITLLVVGLITFPLILAMIPLSAVLPSAVISELPFGVWGAIFAGLGIMLLRQPRAAA